MRRHHSRVENERKRQDLQRRVISRRANAQVGQVQQIHDLNWQFRVTGFDGSRLHKQGSVVVREAQAMKHKAYYLVLALVGLGALMGLCLVGLARVI